VEKTSAKSQVAERHAYPTRFAAAHTRELVEKIIRVPAFLVRHGNVLRLELPAVGILARELREALYPTATQLPLPYAHL
jgi:hypothetical protein